MTYKKIGAEMIAGSRDILLGSVLNVRDVGGMKTSAGQVIKKGRLIRGGMPDGITQSDLDVLVEQHGVTTFIDIRPVEQFSASESSLVALSGANRLNVPVLEHAHEQGQDTKFFANLPFDHVAHGMAILESPARVSEVMTAVGNNSEGATYVHCTAGKDRTGLILAVALSAVGVHPDDIAADYHESEKHLEAVVRGLAAKYEEFGELLKSASADVTRSFEFAPVTDTDEILDAIDEKYGSPLQYLLDLPNGEQIVENLERKLLG